MSLNAVAVELLIDKGGFEPRVAPGIAEAIETSMMQAQIVTVPILDARLQELKALLEIKIESTKAELIRWVFVVMLGNVALNVAAAAIVSAFKHSL
jgi:hypothetical protein